MSTRHGPRKKVFDASLKKFYASFFTFSQLEPIKATSMIGGHELWEGDEAVLVAVVLFQHLVHDLHRPTEPHPLSCLSVLS